MKPFNELSRLGRIRRFRRLAESALDLFGIKPISIEFIRLAGNVVFRVFASNSGRSDKVPEFFAKDQYLLRIHSPLEQKHDSIELEMEWLTAIRRDTGLPVPEPVWTKKGNLLVQISNPGIPGERDCTILRWLKGRLITDKIQPRHFKAQGRLLARLHNHASIWRPPGHLTKRSFDWNGLFKDDAGAGIPNAEAWPLLPDYYRKPDCAVAQRVKRLMGKWRKNPDVYGLIHGDCGVDANVLFWKGEAHPIDFDGSGFGYYLYDLALALEHCWDNTNYPGFRESLLDGYAEFRSLPETHIRNMDLFLAAFYIYMSLWSSAVDQVNPDSRTRLERRRRWQERGMEFITRFIDI